MAAEEERVVTSSKSIAYGRPLEIFTSFQYMGQFILEDDDYWPAVVRNLSRVRMVWKRMTIILSMEGAEPRVSGFFFKDVVQAVFIFV